MTDIDRIANAMREGWVTRVDICREMAVVTLDDGDKLRVPLDEARTSMIWDVSLAAMRRQQAVDAAPEGEGR